MGYDVPIDSRGVKYLATNAQEPFGAQSYVIKVSINSQAPKTAGEIKVLFKAKDKTLTVPMTE